MLSRLGRLISTAAILASTLLVASPGPAAAAMTCTSFAYTTPWIMQYYGANWGTITRSGTIKVTVWYCYDGVKAYHGDNPAGTADPQVSLVSGQRLVQRIATNLRSSDGTSMDFLSTSEYVITGDSNHKCTGDIDVDFHITKAGGHSVSRGFIFTKAPSSYGICVIGPSL